MREGWVAPAHQTFSLNPMKRACRSVVGTFAAFRVSGRGWGVRRSSLINPTGAAFGVPGAQENSGSALNAANLPDDAGAQPDKPRLAGRRPGGYFGPDSISGRALWHGRRASVRT